MDIRRNNRRGGRCRSLHQGDVGACAVVVLGHPTYYPRFGFAPAWDAGLYYRAPGPNPSFMVLELEPAALRGHGGEVRYHPAFDAL